MLKNEKNVVNEIPFCFNSLEYYVAVQQQNYSNSPACAEKEVKYMLVYSAAEGNLTFPF